MTGKTYIVLRFSALGDVAMTLPSLYEAAEEHHRDLFILVTQPFMAKLAVNSPVNLQTLTFDKREHKGWSKLIAFARSLHQQYPDAVIIDLHDVLRTKVIRSTLKALGHKVVSLKKPRQARSKLLSKRKEAKVPRKLYVTPMTDVYIEALERAGIKLLSKGKAITPEGKKFDRITIGIAPHAQHRGKMISDEQVLELIDVLNAKFPGCDLILYGAPGIEARRNRGYVAQRQGKVRMTSSRGLAEEIHEIARLHYMISMDSANQHIAAMVGTPVLSLWGATHPAAGFIPFRVPESQCIGVDIECRPCSIYGNKPCYRKDYACLARLPINQIPDLLDIRR